MSATANRDLTDGEAVVSRVLTALDVIDDGQMRLLRALPHPDRTSLGPFVFVDHYRHTGVRGIGDRPHPHAGIEVVSYLLEGGVEHRDSLGNRDRLAAGDAQWIRAGRGMLHAEQPLGGRHGLQLWLSLPPELKQVDPAYLSFAAADIPEAVGPGTRLRVVAGDIDGLRGPMPLTGDGVFAVLQLDRDASAVLRFAAPRSRTARELGVYVLEGAARVGARTVAAGDLATLGPGDAVSIEAGGGGPVELALFGGSPVTGDVLFSGPFVMDTQARLDAARRDYAAGRMGRLEGVPF